MERNTLVHGYHLRNSPYSWLVLTQKRRLAFCCFHIYVTIPSNRSDG